VRIQFLDLCDFKCKKSLTREVIGQKAFWSYFECRGTARPDQVPGMSWSSRGLVTALLLHGEKFKGRVLVVIVSKNEPVRNVQLSEALLVAS